MLTLATLVLVLFACGEPTEVQPASCDTVSVNLPDGQTLAAQRDASGDLVVSADPTDESLGFRPDVTTAEACTAEGVGCEMARRLPYPGRAEFQCWCPAAE